MGINWCDGRKYAWSTRLDTCGSFPITLIFRSKVPRDYSSVPAGQCPLCKAGVKLDALVNSYGISSFI